MRHQHSLAAVSGILLGGLLLSGCTPDTGDDDGVGLTLVTHGSFYLSEGILDGFTDETGIEVEVVTGGDGGALVNQLVLTAGAPLGDVVFGIDNSFAGRAATAGILEDYLAAAAADGPASLLLDEDAGGGSLTPIDFGDVCWNADLAWFDEHGLALPETLDDLIDPAYRGLLVAPAATTSSPGLAFLHATIAAFGEDGWEDYWHGLVANDIAITGGWSDAYYVDFSGPSSEGTRPLVLSYASSPAAEIDTETGQAGTVALLDTCYRQVEYAGVLAGTAHPDEARQLIDFLYSLRVQEDIPWSMFVYPANPAASLPPEFVEHAAVATDPYMLDPLMVDQQREEWLTAWADIVTG